MSDFTLHLTLCRIAGNASLVVTDYDRTNRTVSISKARVDGIDKDCTKTHEDRRIKLCPRAVVILERQLRFRARLVAEGRIDHPYLFITDEGNPRPDVKYPYARWERTLRRLKMRYRRPYAARHTSVSWNLMIGRNALLVAKEHGHRPLTMLTVYAAWTEGAPESDIRAIRHARNPNGRRGVRHLTGTDTSPSASDAVNSVNAESQPRGRRIASHTASEFRSSKCSTNTSGWTARIP
jgi:integrase